MKKAFAVLFVLLSLGSVTQAYAGNCQESRMIAPLMVRVVVVVLLIPGLVVSNN